MVIINKNNNTCLFISIAVKNLNWIKGIQYKKIVASFTSLRFGWGISNAHLLISVDTALKVSLQDVSTTETPFGVIMEGYTEQFSVSSQIYL